MCADSKFKISIDIVQYNLNCKLLFNKLIQCTCLLMTKECARQVDIVSHVLLAKVERCGVAP